MAERSERQERQEGKGGTMISVGSYRILHKSEFSKFEKLHKIFWAFSEEMLDAIITGKVHLHKNPKKKERINGRSESV